MTLTIDPVELCIGDPGCAGVRWRLTVGMVAGPHLRAISIANDGGSNLDTQEVMEYLRRLPVQRLTVTFREIIDLGYEIFWLANFNGLPNLRRLNLTGPVGRYEWKSMAKCRLLENLQITDMGPDPINDSEDIEDVEVYEFPNLTTLSISSPFLEYDESIEDGDESDNADATKLPPRFQDARTYGRSQSRFYTQGMYDRPSLTPSDPLPSISTICTSSRTCSFLRPRSTWKWTASHCSQASVAWFYRAKCTACAWSIETREASAS